MAALLVTVVGDRRRLDLVVPADVPVGELLAPLTALLAAAPPAAAPGGGPTDDPRAVPPAAPGGGPLGVAGADPPGRFRLGPVGGEPLPPERSLAAGGVGHGAILALSDGAAPPPELGAAVAAPSAAGGAGPPRPCRCVTVAVVSAAGGAGRTTVTVLLAWALGAVGDLVVAVDADPGPGSLTERLAPGHEPSPRTCRSCSSIPTSVPPTWRPASPGQS
jgi:WXG100 protein secretion system (Wss), protein YukD